MRLTASSVLVVLTAVFAVGSCKQMKADSEPTGESAAAGEASAELSSEASTTENTASDESASSETATDDAEQTTETSDGPPERVSDASGRFSTSVPAGWSIEKAEGTIHLSAPESELQVHLVAVETEDPAAAVEQAWRRSAPDRRLTVRERLDVPTDEGVDQQMVVDYKIGKDGRFAQAIAQRHDETTYVILVDGTRGSVETHSDQLQHVGDHFEIAAIDRNRLEDRAAEPLGDEQFETLETYIRNGMDQFGVPGAAVGIVQDGEVAWTRGFGLRRKGGEAEVDAETMMLSGSATATMTAMLMGTAVDAGRMDWQTPARELLSTQTFGDAPSGGAVTVEHLICGCVDVPSRTMEVLFNYRSMGAEEIVTSASDLPFQSEFGETFQYSNHLAATGGYAAAAALGAEWGSLRSGFRKAMEGRIFEPIGMSASTVDFAQADDTGNQARPHALDVKARYQPISSDLERFAEPVAPARGVWTNARELSRYLATQVERGTAPTGDRVVSADQLTHTWEPRVEMSDERSYGLGWATTEYGGKRVLSHTAQTMGFSSHLAFVPEDDVGIAVMVNAAAAEPFAEAVRSRVLQMTYRDDETTEWSDVLLVYRTPDRYAEIREATADTIERDRVESYLGRYEHRLLGGVDLRARNGRAWLDVGEFDAEVKPLRGARETPMFVGVDPPLVGVQVSVAGAKGEGRTMTIRNGEESYELAWVE